MHTTLIIAQVIISIIIITTILLQQKGVGLGGVFGGEGNVYRSRRGAEKALFWLTILLAVAYAVIAVIAAFVTR